MPSRPTILVYEDMDEQFGALTRALVPLGYRLQRAATPEAFASYAPYAGFELVIIDLYRGPRIANDLVGMDLLRRLRLSTAHATVLVASDQEPTRQLVAEAYREGASDYVDKRELFADPGPIIERARNRGGDSLERRLEAELPLPMAFLFRDYNRSAAAPRRRLERLVEVFEVGLKLAAFSLLAACRQPLASVMSGDLRKALALPSLGHFSSVINVLPEPPGFTATLWQATRSPAFRELVGRFIALRNAYLGHGGMQADVVYERLLVEHGDDITEWLSSLAFFRQAAIVVPLKSELPDKGFLYDLRVYRGSNPVPTVDRRTYTMELRPSKDAFLLSAAGDDAVGLGPWVQYLRCKPGCDMEKLFLYQRARRGLLHVFDHVYGHSIESRAGWQTLHQLMGEGWSS